jgi:hypothetical protein
MAEVLLWCLLGFAGAVACFLLASAWLCFCIADECDQHARHIDNIDRQGGEGWE